MSLPRSGARTLWLVALCLGSCSYKSQYVAPADGRARVVWTGEGVQARLPGASAACQAAVAQARQAPVYARTHPTVVVAPVVDIGHHHHHHHHAAHAVAHARPHAVPAAGGGGHPVAPAGGGGHPVAPASGSAHPVAPASSDAAAGTGGVDDAPPELWAAAAVVAIIALPIIAVSLAATDPVDARSASEAIDAVNAYNDLARVTGTACSPPPPEPAPQPTPVATPVAAEVTP